MAVKRSDEGCCSSIPNLFRTMRQIWSKGGTRLFKVFITLTLLLYMLFCVYILTVLLKDDMLNKVHDEKPLDMKEYIKVEGNTEITPTTERIKETTFAKSTTPGSDLNLGKRGDKLKETRDDSRSKTRSEQKEEDEKLVTKPAENPIVTTEEGKIVTTVKPETFPEERKVINVEALSGKERVYVMVNNSFVIDVKKNKERRDKDRGIHCIAINQFTGMMVAHRAFDTFLESNSELLIQFIDSLQKGRLIILAVFDEGSYAFDVKDRQYFIDKYDSRKLASLNWRNTWVFAFKIGDKTPYAEDFHSDKRYNNHGAPSRIGFEFELEHDNRVCVMHSSPKATIWKKFCNENDGIGKICDCENPDDTDVIPPSLDSIQARGQNLTNNIAGIPIAVIGGNRPHYLYRMLHHLVRTPGVERNMVNVFIDGNYSAPNEVAQLFGVHYQNNLRQCDGACAIQQNYKHSLTSIFDKYPQAKYVIILEEDLKVAIDLFDYFSQTIPLLEMDESLFCISAWNDNGYAHSVGDPALLYRIETMPGLGWVLKRKIYKNELEPYWPKVGEYWHWDMWVRMYKIKNRECIIPDISRTFHFGSQGVNMDAYFHKILFKTHALNDKPGNVFNISTLMKDNYEAEMHRLISSAHVLNHTKNPCKDKDFIPDTVGQVYVVYIRYKRHSKTERTWNTLAKCFHIWSLDDRGFHKLMFRLYLKQNMVFVVGTRSPYAIYKPKDVVPIANLKD